MKKSPTIAQSAQAIIDIWSEHVAMYARSKREIEALRGLVELMRSQVTELATEATRLQKRLPKTLLAKRQQVTSKLREITKDQRKYGGLVKQWDQQLVELEQKLEATWDIW